MVTKFRSLAWYMYKSMTTFLSVLPHMRRETFI